MAENDVELWGNVLSGDASAWSRLVRRYQSLVYAVCTRAGLSAADVADCFQETWVALYENRRKLRDPSRLSSWLVTTAKREALRLRYQAKRGSDEDAQVDVADAGPLSDEEMMILERQAQLEIAIEALDPRCRLLIERFFFAPGKDTYEQIAASIGIASNSLGASRRRCLNRLKEILLKSGFLDARNDAS